MLEIKDYDFLESDNFEKESNTFISSLISQIVKPHNIEGFIYSFFIDIFNPKSRRNILPLNENNNLFLLKRNPDLFDSEKEIITLTDKEIEYIQKEYFVEQLDRAYKKLFTDLDSFHRHFEINNKFSLQECYDIVLNFLNDNKGLFKGNISNINNLNLTNFKDLTESKLLKYRNAVENKKSLLQSYSKIESDSTYPKDIFKSISIYKHFKEYIGSYIEEPYKDYSYLFQRMLAEDYIYRILHKEFAYWLLNEQFISEDEYELIMEKGNFMSLNKSESKVRKINFENIFN